MPASPEPVSPTQVQAPHSTAAGGASQQTVILREQELDCDVATAIARVRSRPGSANARILVIGPEPAQQEDPGADRTSACVPRLPRTLAQVVREHEAEILQPVGRRMLELLSCLERFSEEEREIVQELESEVPEQPRARLQSRLHALREIHEWSSAVIDDLRQEMELAADGQRPVEMRGRWLEVGEHLESTCAGVQVSVQATDVDTTVFGRSAELAELCHQALVLVAARIGGHGSVRVEFAHQEGWLATSVRGSGEAHAVESVDAIGRFRHLVATRHGGRIAPDEHGPGGCGMTILLPRLGRSR